MSGPGDTNFKHAKLDYPMEYPSFPNTCHWFAWEPSPFRHPPRVTKQCNEKCVTRSIIITPMIRFRVDDRPAFDWEMQLEPAAQRWMVPGETSPDRLDPDNIWISGTGGRSSIVHLEGKWWVLFGTYEIKRPDDRPDLPGREVSKRIKITHCVEKEVSHFLCKVMVLHEMTWEPWKPACAEATKDVMKSVFLRKVTGE